MMTAKRLETDVHVARCLRSGSTGSPKNVSHYRIINKRIKPLYNTYQLDLTFRQIKSQSKTKILSLGIKYSMRDLYVPSIKPSVREKQKCDMRHVM